MASGKGGRRTERQQRARETLARILREKGSTSCRCCGALRQRGRPLILGFELVRRPCKPERQEGPRLGPGTDSGRYGLLSGIYFTWRTLQVNREGQITERFTRAIDQLGKTKQEGNELFEIRLGGIYALERIARESEKDHWPIMEILTAYVRQYAPWRPAEGQGGEANAAVVKKSAEDSKEATEPAKVTAPAPDIQAILTVIRRRTRSYGQGEPEVLDLHEADLSGANLYGANLSGADLSGANLSGADLSRANLSNAILRKADFSGAGLYGADLSGANLLDANLLDASLSDANLSGATLYGTNLSDANLSGANLLRASLSVEDHSQVNRKAWTIYIVYPSHTNHQGGLVSVNNLSDANLSGANLSGADLSDATLSQVQLDVTIGDENTQLPPYLKLPARWSVKADEQTELE